VANEQLTEANTVLEETLERLNPGVSRLIGSNRQQLGLVYATELVSDVCNYTKLNMILGETLMGEFMKKFFRESHKLLAQYRGMFDKTVGDQIVAIFGTPKDDSPASPTHAFDAIACALKLMEAAEGINRIMQTAIQDNYTAIVARHQSLSSEDRKTIRIEDLKFQCRVGINTSNPTSDREIDRMRMVMMGAETCIDYTAQGGAVIYAFRLESSGTPGEIHIGENTKRLVDHVYRLEDMPPITLKGLGVQPGYRVVGEGSLFENIYPRTRFYRRYAGNLPETLTRLAATLQVGRIQIREVQQINEYLEVDIPYVEHMTGCYNLSVSRALLAHAVGAHLDLPEPRLASIIFAALWHNALSLSRIALEALIPNGVADQVPEGMDADPIAAVVAQLDARRPVLEEAKIIAVCNQFDEMVFDRTYLKGRAKEVLTAKEVLSLMRIEEKFDAALIDALAFLMIAPEEAEEEETVAAGPSDPIHLPQDPAVLAEAIRKHLPESAITALFTHLREDALD
jgi:class 3 adenylate cyclase